PTPRRSKPSITCAGSKASSRRSSRRTHWPTRPSWRRPCPRTRSCWSTSPAVATRTCTPSPSVPASSSEPAPGRICGPQCDRDMSRIQTVFQRLQADGRKALIPFVTAGFPTPELTLPLMNALVDGGADIIELGVPFSDPMADGPTIHRASERALAQGMSPRKVLDTVRAFRAGNPDTPVVLMGYANPIEAMGQDRFVTAAHEAGVDGVLVVDYPPEECDTFAATAKAGGLDPIFLLAPTSSEQ